MLFIGSTLINFSGFIFHSLLTKLITPTEYGVFAALGGLITLISIPSGALDLIVTKMVSSFEVESQASHSKSFVKYLAIKITKIYLLLLPIMFLASIWIKSFFHLPDIIGVFSVWLIIYFSLISIVIRSTLKGLLKFKDMITNQLIESATRIFISMVLIFYVLPNYLAPQFGSLVAVIISVSLLIMVIRKILPTNASSFIHHNWPLRTIGITSLIISASYSMMYSIDLVLTRHFLSSHLSGLYAALSIAGKMVFFAEAPIAAAIIPFVARKTSTPHEARSDYLILLTLVSALSVFLLGSLGLFSKQIVGIIFTQEFMEISPYLFWMGFAYFMYSLANISASFLMALGHFRISLVSLAAVGLETIAIIRWHSNIFEIILSLLSVFGMLSLVLISYSLYVTRKK